MIVCYRLHHSDYPASEGIGAMLYGGRWNQRGTEAIYTASSRRIRRRLADAGDVPPVPGSPRKSMSGPAAAWTQSVMDRKRHAGYPGMIGAMFWTLDADRRGNYNYSNVVGPQLHGYPATKGSSQR